MRHALAALLLSTAPALAEMPPGISHFTLPNGLEAVVIEDHRAPVVVQMVWYRIGSADEAPGKSGIAHYLEHLMFKGTDRLAPGELSKIVAANGGIDNAFTSYDYTAYFQRIASDRLDLVMGMEADRMANLRISENDWLTERDVVIEERAQRTDSDPASIFAEERYAAQYLNHPYGRPVIGWKHEAERLTREDALAWYDAHYAPDEAVLVVAGDVTAEEVRRLAETHYGPIPPSGDGTRDARPQEPAQHAPRRLRMVDPRVHPNLHRAFRSLEQRRQTKIRPEAPPDFRALLQKILPCTEPRVFSKPPEHGFGRAVGHQHDSPGLDFDQVQTIRFQVRKCCRHGGATFWLVSVGQHRG